MKILLLGPPAPRIESYFLNTKHCLTRLEEPLTLDWLKDKEFNFEFTISYRYRYIISESVLAALNYRAINLHISFLPYNRGADPNLWSFLNDTPKGVTIHLIDSGLNTGDILLQKLVDLDISNETLRTSYEKLCTNIEDLFLDNVNLLLENKIPQRKQSEQGTIHRKKDKAKFLYLLENYWWDTQVSSLIGVANQCELNNYQVKEETENIKLKPAVIEDSEFLFNLANDPDCHAMSFRDHKISYQSHINWLKMQIDQHNPFYIIFFNNIPCGYVRIQKENLSSDIYLISIAISNKFRNKGIATKALTKSCRIFINIDEVAYIKALIKDINYPSKKIFSKAHFIEIGYDLIKTECVRIFIYPAYSEIV